MKETQLVTLIINYLIIKGHYVWRNNSGFFKHDYTTKAGINKTSAIRAGIKGGSDIVGVSKYGKFIAIECKVGKNKPTELQEMFLKEIESRGGHAIVAYSLEDVSKFLF